MEGGRELEPCKSGQERRVPGMMIPEMGIPQVSISVPCTPTGLPSEAMRAIFSPEGERPPGNHWFRDKRFDSFKTWSGRLERQISSFRGRPQEEVEDDVGVEAPPPVARYFDALHGPELDMLKVRIIKYRKKLFFF